MPLFSRAWAAGVVGALCLGTATRHAHGEPPTPFRVESLPGATCRSGDPFATQLLLRTDRIREAVGDEQAVVFRVEVTLGPARTTGRLTVRELDGSELRRDVAGADCAEVMSAMVLIAAILVDPNASLEPLPAPRAAPPPPPPPPPPRNRAAPAPRGPVIPAGRTPPPGALVRPRRHGESARSAKPAEPAPREGAREAAQQRSAPGRLVVGAGVRLALEGAPMPKLAAGMAVGGAVSLERGSILSPLLEGSAVRTQTVNVATPSGVAAFRFASARLLACPLRFPPASTIAVRPCALGEVGELQGIGKVTEHPELVTARWVAVGAAARATVRLFGPLALVGEGAVVVPLIRHEFYFEPLGPKNTALTVPAVGTSTRLGVLAEFE